LGGEVKKGEPQTGFVKTGKESKARGGVDQAMVGMVTKTT